MRIVWVANRRRFGSKIACANSKEGYEVGVGPVTQQVTNYIAAAGGYVKEIRLMSGTATG